MCIELWIELCVWCDVGQIGRAAHREAESLLIGFSLSWHHVRFGFWGWWRRDVGQAQKPISTRQASHDDSAACLWWTYKIRVNPFHSAGDMPFTGSVCSPVCLSVWSWPVCRMIWTSSNGLALELRWKEVMHESLVAGVLGWETRGPEFKST